MPRAGHALGAIVLAFLVSACAETPLVEPANDCIAVDRKPADATDTTSIGHPMTDSANVNAALCGPEGYPGGPASPYPGDTIAIPDRPARPLEP